jgi:hypothetical protein
MELVLNLLWLLLVLPAYFLWRSAPEARSRRWFSSRQCLLALVCVLVLLFPVISATDDLHAMRAEMEESSANRKNMRAAGHDRGSPWNSHWQSPAILLASGSLVPFCNEGRLERNCVSRSLPAAPASLCFGRAPPVADLA